ncbi:MAG TPA: hypothetical protein VFQ39_15640 [Longimicrobium sp.]|nr:hypothetical protein [Longimicrobium sp.]
MARKLKLEDLQLTSFSVMPGADGQRGTVRGHSDHLSAASCYMTQFYECTCGSGASFDTFCPTGGECAAQTRGPGQSCMPSCINYTCEGATCARVIC